MELRTVLYGYCKYQFSFLVNEEEASIVRRIFSDYISGKTLLQISTALTQEKVAYYRDRTTWSKQTVRRVIENPHYTGDYDYPAIIDEEIYQMANAVRLEKGGERQKDSPEIRYLKYHTKCTQCGARVTRKNHYSGQREAWYCVNGCKTNRYLDDKAFFADIYAIINRVIHRPELLICTEGEGSIYSPSIKVQRDERTLSDLLQKDKVSFQSAKKALFDILSEKFDCCTLDRTADVTDALIAHIGDIEQIDSVDVDLFKVIIEEILINKNGEVTVRFVNDAVIGKDKGVMTNE